MQTGSFVIPPKPLYTVDEAAILFGVCRNTIGNWVKTGQIKSIKRGRRRYIPASEIVVQGDAA